MGHPKNQLDGLSKIYDQVLRADRELNQLYADLPIFLKQLVSEEPEVEDSPTHVRIVGSISMLSMAHKVCYIVLLRSVVYDQAN